MCGRYTLRRIELLEAVLDAIAEYDSLIPRYNVAIGQFMPIAYEHDDGHRITEAMWSLVPSNAPTKLKLSTFNAHGDRLQSSPLWRGPFNHQRCIVPADGWYEWPEIDGRKRPMFIHRADDEVFGFAGLYTRWTPADSDEEIFTYSIVTAAPDEFGRKYHHRWPVILDRKDYARWLDRNVDGPGVADLLRGASDGLEAYEVGKKIGVSKRTNDDPSLIERVS